MIFNRKKHSNVPLFVSIGAGEQQLPLIVEARGQGFKVVGVDRNPRAPGAAFCDIKIQESIDNHREIIEKLREVSIYGDIQGVLTKSYGKAVRSACHVAREMGISMIPPGRVDDFIDKRKMKRVFSRNGIPSPGFETITAAALSRNKQKIPYPAVIKPLSGHGKKDVRLLRSPAEMDRFLSRSVHRSFLLEEYVSADEVIAAGIVFRGTYHLVRVSDKVTSPAPYFVDLLHLYPSRYAGLENRITRIGQQVASAFEIDLSPLIMEILVTADGDLFLIEAAPEYGGEYIPDILAPRGTGYNFLGEAVRAATGGKFSPPGKPERRSAVAIKYITGKNGVIASYNRGAADLIPGIVLSRIFPEPGASVKRPVNNHDRIGVIAAAAHTPEDARSLAEKAEEALSIVIK